MDENLTSMFLVFTPSVRVEHFWVDLDGRHISTPTSSVGVMQIGWCVRDLNFKSMTNLSLGSTKLDKTQHIYKQHINGWFS